MIEIRIPSMLPQEVLQRESGFGMYSRMNGHNSTSKENELQFFCDLDLYHIDSDNIACFSYLGLPETPQKIYKSLAYGVSDTSTVNR